MFERFTERARKVIIFAREEAIRLGHSHVGPEHLLLGLIREGDGLADPKTAGVDQRETGAVERLADRTDQAAAVGIAAKVGKAFAKGQPDFFFVRRGQS